MVSGISPSVPHRDADDRHWHFVDANPYCVGSRPGCYERFARRRPKSLAPTDSDSDTSIWYRDHLSLALSHAVMKLIPRPSRHRDGPPLLLNGAQRSDNTRPPPVTKVQLPSRLKRANPHVAA